MTIIQAKMTWMAPRTIRHVGESRFARVIHVNKLEQNENKDSSATTFLKCRCSTQTQCHEGFVSASREACQSPVADSHFLVKEDKHTCSLQVLMPDLGGLFTPVAVLEFILHHGMPCTSGRLPCHSSSDNTLCHCHCSSRPKWSRPSPG